MLDAHFTDIKNVILSRLDSAESSIYVCVCWFTDSDLLDKLCEKARAEVSVALMMYDDDINGRLDFTQLENAGGRVFKVEDELMHNKFCVIDQNIVLTGSPNWSYAANKTDRDENLVEVTGELQFAYKFVDEFKNILNRRLGIKEIHHTKAFDLPKVLKRLQLLKQLIELEDLDEIAPHLKKLEKFHLPTEVEQIIGKLQEEKYGDGVAEILAYTSKHQQLTQYVDPEIEALKLEIKVVELEIASAETELLEIQKQLYDFNIQHNRILGDIIRQILELRKEIFRMEAAEDEADEKAKEKYEEAQNDYKEYNKDYEELKSKTYHELTEEETIDLKKTYRKASLICHPDRNMDEPEEVREQLERIFKELNEANSENDLKKVKEILVRLETKEFSNISSISLKDDSLKNKEKLRSRIASLKSKLNDLKSEIENVLNSETYTKVFEIEDFTSYFNKTRTQLQKQLTHLLDKLNNLKNGEE